MRIIRILRWLRGYISIIIKSAYIERVMNMCNHLGIDMWKFRETDDDDSYECYIRLKDFKKFIKVIKKTHSRFRIQKKYGLPFYIFRYRKRIPLIVGIVTSLLLMIYLSTYIWDINLIGNYSYTPSEIMAFLEENGIVHGIRKSKIDSDEIEKLIRNNYFDITWVSVEISGTRMNIHIKENFDDFIVKNEEQPYSLVASRDGEITSIITRSGTPKVKAGDTVKAGDVLVSGIVEVYGDSGEVIDTKYVNADADIKARTVYEYEDSFSLSHTIKEYTGRTYKRHAISIFNRYVTLDIVKKKYSEYDVVNEDTRLKAGDSFYLPIAASSYIYREFKTAEAVYTDEEANALAEENFLLFKEKLTKRGAVIESENIDSSSDGQNFITKGTITVVECISRTESISEEEIAKNNPAKIEPIQ